MRRPKCDPVEWVLMAGVAAIALLLAAMVVGFLGIAIADYQTHHHPTGCVVNGKDRAGKDSEMRVYTDNCGVFVVQDATWIGHFNSADVYNSIEVGKSYDFDTIGMRIPLVSDFPNIITATPAVAR